jgi:hypothetical protein
MLTKVIPVTTWTTDEKLPYDKVSSIQGVNTLFQGGKQKKKNRGDQRSRSETKGQVRSEEPEPKSQSRWTKHTRTKESDQISSKGSRINTEVKTQSA